MAEIPNISDAEWEIMKVLWRKSPITAQEVVDQVAEPMSWNPKTVKALISRLVKKHAIRFEAAGKVYYYSAAVAEEECVREERKSFLKRIYGGALSPSWRILSKMRS